jgi:biotin-(acetyl-CoA carboxylase) ligase
VVTAPDRSVAGEACGVDAHGALIVQTAQGVVALSSGEVSVRFAAQTQEH